MDEYLYLLDTAASLENVLDRLREKEGFVADGYEVVECTTLIPLV